MPRTNAAPTSPPAPPQERFAVAPESARAAARALRRIERRWAPPPRLTVSEWADRYRHLSAEASAEPGLWRTSRAEYLRGIMDALSDPLAPRVVLMKSAQVGGTELLLNVTGFFVHQDPAPILVVQPTVEMGEAWSKDRLAPMLRDSPALRGRVSDPKSRDGNNTRLHKVFPGGHVTIAGANSAASLASRPIRVLLCDEVDRYPPSAGTEGDPVGLAEKRTTTFWNRKVFLNSTPTLAGTSRIEAAYQDSDRRRYWVPCPHCGERQVLKWANVRWPEGDPAAAAYHCAECGAAWGDAERWAAVREGVWRAEAPFNGTAGFHISELYSPWRRLAETVADFLAAKGSPERLKVWVNTALGETWRERGDAPEWQRLFERREAYPMGVVPAGAVVLTAGVDAQDDRLECHVWAWGEGLERWLVDFRAFPGSPRDAAPWDALRGFLAAEFPRDGGGPGMAVAMACADTGGRDTTAVYGHIRRIGLSALRAIKGEGGWAKTSPVTGPSPVYATVAGKKVRRGLQLWSVHSGNFKAELYGALHRARDGDGYPPGWVHIPEGADAEWVKQLVAEELRTVKDRRGFARQEWAKLRDRNEALDCAVYARAALWMLGADRLGPRFWAERARKSEKAAEKRAETPAQAPPTEVPAAPAPPKPPPGAGRPGRSRFWKPSGARGPFSGRW